MNASVIVFTYNHAHLLERALTALTGQKTPPVVARDVIVVDDNSRDDTRAVVEQAQATSPVRVTYAFERQQGQSYAVNHGIGLASGDVLASTDDDCRPEVMWPADVLAALETWDADGLSGRFLPAWFALPPRWLAGEAHLWMAAGAAGLDHVPGSRAGVRRARARGGNRGREHVVPPLPVHARRPLQHRARPKGTLPYRSNEPDFLKLTPAYARARLCAHLRIGSRAGRACVEVPGFMCSSASKLSPLPRRD